VDVGNEDWPHRRGMLRRNLVAAGKRQSHRSERRNNG
jgi:hypothetical protein